MHTFVRALEPVARALGGEIVDPDKLVPSDVELVWDGVVVGGLRLPDMHGALGRLIAGVERDLGAPLSELTREDKQRAVALLDERGAFVLRKSVEAVAEALAVSRFTVYNYLARSESGAETEG